LPGEAPTHLRAAPAEPAVHIAYVTETFPPEVNGVALTVARVVQHLRAAGHAVQLLRPRQRGEAPLCSAQEWRSPSGPIPMYPDLRFGWVGAGTLRRVWRETVMPDLVHVATPGPLAWTALHVARDAGIATSADFRTNFHAYSRHYRLGLLEPAVLGHLRRLHALADANFVPTPALARSLAAQGFERLQVVGRGVDSRQFDPRHRSRVLRGLWGVHDDRAPVLLYVGRLAAEKNVALALSCWQALRARRPELRLVVVGDGPLRRRLQTAYPDVLFTGTQQGDALARCYASADLFLFPSLTDTFGNVLLEAMASGLVVVAFDMAAAALHVHHGHNGWLAAPQDEAGFAVAAGRALHVLAAGGPAAAALRQQARQAALAADWDTQLTVFEQRLRALVAARQPAPALQHAALV
jgi:glycosyltransferase involved in cell wall biosynthesis